MADVQFKYWDEQIHKLESFRNLLQDQKNGEDYDDTARDVHQRVARLEEETEGVRHYRFANETLGDRHGRNSFLPTYLSGRHMSYPSQGKFLMQSPGQKPVSYVLSSSRTQEHVRSLTSLGSFFRKDYRHFYANPQFAQPHPSDPYASLCQFPLSTPADNHYTKASPPLSNPLQALSKRTDETEPPPSNVSHTNNPNLEKNTLLPSPVIRSNSRASFVSQAGNANDEVERELKYDDNRQPLPEQPEWNAATPAA